MVDRYDRWQEEIEVALKEIVQVAEQRHDITVLVKCNGLLLSLATSGAFSPEKWGKNERKYLLEEIGFQASRLAEDLTMLVNLEMREIVFPLPEIKESTREFGNIFTPSRYLNWLPPEQGLAPEDIVRLLQRQLDKLKVASDILKKEARSSYANGSSL
jgi:hypothetical protein